MNDVGRLFFLIFIYPIVWLVWVGPRLVWQRWAYPYLESHGRRRLVWLGWGVIVLYLAIDKIIFEMAHGPNPGYVWLKIEQLRVIVTTLVNGLLFAAPAWVLIHTKDNPALGVLAQVAILAAGTFLASFVLLAPFLVWVRAPKRGAQRDSHGTACWGSPDQAAASGLLFPKDRVGGLMLGRFVEGVSKKLDPRLRTTRHVLTCAPTRSGKGVGCVIPHLLEYPGSIFCLDLKGENAAVTSGRRIALRNEVAIIDPFGVTGWKTKAVNWIDWLDTSSPECVSEAAALADMLVVRSGDQESHWDDAAQSFLQGLLLHVASLPQAERHPGKLRDILTMPEAEFVAFLEQLSEDKVSGYGLVARMSNTMLQKVDRERSGVISTAHRHTAFLDDPRIVESLKRSEVDFAKLKTERMTVYLVMPPDKLRSQSRYVRAVVYMALRGVLRVQGRPEVPVTFLLDEFAQLGRMSAVEDAVSLLAGYGAWLWLLVQDLSQLKAVYPKWETFLANTTLQAFGTQDQYTARYLSEAIGSETIMVESAQQSRSAPEDFLRPGSNTQGTAFAAHGRPLLMPDEVRRLSERQVVVLQQGQPPYLLQRLDYLADPELAGLGDPNPMYAAVQPAQPRPAPAALPGVSRRPGDFVEPDGR